MVSEIKNDQNNINLNSTSTQMLINTPKQGNLHLWCQLLATFLPPNVEALRVSEN